MKKDKLEYEFLPSALEIEETPPAPMGRFVIWIIFILIVLFISWAYFTKTDEVAVARGKIIPTGRAKVIEPLEEGIVKNIYVKEGELIKKGQLLLELDTTIKIADLDELEESLSVLKLEHLMASFNLKQEFFKDNESLYEKVEYKKLSKNRIDFIVKLQTSKLNEYKEKLITQKHIITEAEAQMNIAESQLEQLEVKNELVENEEKMLEGLAGKGSVSKREWWQKKSESDVLDQQIKSQEVEIQKSSYKIEEAKHSLNVLEREWDTDNLSQIVETEKKIKSITTQLTKAKKMFELKYLHSPVDGIVNQLEVTTIGEVVTPGQAIITIVPSDMPILAEVMVLNKDIGFIKLDQKAELKLDTFPFHKYGIVEGKVVNISPDAILDKQTGQLVYKILIKPEKNKIFVDGRYVSIVPGMSLSAEIKTGTRRVIEFFLDPISKFKDEGFKLR